LRRGNRSFTPIKLIPRADFLQLKYFAGDVRKGGEVLENRPIVANNFGLQIMADCLKLELEQSKKSADKVPEGRHNDRVLGREMMKSRQSHHALSVAAGAILGVLALSNVAAAAASEGEKLAFNRSKGNCLTCHAIKGGADPGNVGPELSDMKTRFPDRKELIAIVSDETKRNELTVMPPFKRNLILNDKEIEAIVDFLYTR
jgi:sulfur-oxidizing protein SoxX